MRVVFDCALDGNAWPGPLGQVDFAYGEAWVGPMGLLDLLETRLGLGGRFEAPLERACRLAVRLRESSGYWDSSFEVDPLATCRRLLSDRDQLRLAGWTGQPVSARIAELAAATADIAPGVSDRLHAIASALEVRSTGIERLRSYTTFANLPPLWRRVFSALRHSGTEIEEQGLEPAPAEGDLASARRTPFAPTGDGRLCLLRRHGVLDVADEIAATLAASDNLDRVVVIGADPVLDQAFGRHGLPRLGVHADPPASNGLLGLVVAAAFHPMHMAELHALLAADPGPIPRGIAVRMLDAVRQIPGRRTEAWRDALARGLEQIDEDRRDEIERRVRTLLMPATAHDRPLPVSALRERLELLEAWARARAPHAPSLVLLSQRIRTLLDATLLIGATELSKHELRRLCDDVGEPLWTASPAETGLAHVPQAGAILAPARAIVWWNFARDSVIHPTRLLLTAAERDGLRDLGIEPPDPAAAMAIRTDAWRRPLSQAEQTLVLACPLTDRDGQASHPHPLWDDVVAGLADVRQAHKLERTRVGGFGAAKREAVALRPLPTPCRSVQLAAPIGLRDRESPSSIEKLFGCSLAWALQYRAGLESKITDGPATVGPLVFGKLAHLLLEQVLADSASPDAAAETAASLFDEQATGLCEELGLPQHQSDRATVKRAVVESARDLAGLARGHNARGIATEVAGEVIVEGQRIVGRLDLVWEDPAVVLDLKWGKSSPSALLETGTAVQLAAYAAMQAAKGPWPESGYYVLNNQRLLAEPGGRLAAGALVQGSQRGTSIWSAAVATLHHRREALAAGRLDAPGAENEEIRAAFAPAELTVQPPCRYCGFAGLCGRGGAR